MKIHRLAAHLCSQTIKLYHPTMISTRGNQGGSDETFSPAATRTAHEEIAEAYFTDVKSAQSAAPRCNKGENSFQNRFNPV